MLISFRLGSVPAMALIAEHFESGIPGFLDVDLSKAIEWLEKAASGGDHDAGEKLIRLVANPSLIDGIFEFGYTAPAA